MVEHQVQRRVVVALGTLAQFLAHLLPTPLAKVVENLSGDPVYVVVAKKRDQVALDGGQVVVVAAAFGLVCCDLNLQIPLNDLRHCFELLGNNWMT